MMLSSLSIASSNATEGRPETEGGSGDGRFHRYAARLDKIEASRRAPEREEGNGTGEKAQRAGSSSEST
jgi:hypothetical protein